MPLLEHENLRELTGVPLAEAVALEVMGWEPVWMLTAPTGGAFVSGHFGSAAECERYWQQVPDMAWRLGEGWSPQAHWSLHGNTFGVTVDNWRPDRDIGQAWEVLLSLHRDWLNSHVAWLEDTDADFAVWECRIGTPPHAFHGYGNTASEAICRTALMVARRTT